MKNTGKNTPKIAELILARLFNRNDNEILLGDLEEIYLEKRSETGNMSAFFWYWKQAVGAFLQIIGNKFYWSAVMIRNYLKITFRNIKRHKSYSFINVFGFAVGLACSILIMLWVQDELSYDKFHDKSENIYRIVWKGNFAGMEAEVATSVFAVGPYLVDNYPEVLNYVRFRRIYRRPVTYEGRSFFEDRMFYSDNTVFEIFSQKLLKGDQKTALTAPFSVVMTEETAERYFGDEEPIGKIVEMNNGDSFTVTGVMENVPENSHFIFDMLFSFETLFSYNPRQRTLWLGDFNNYTYLLLQDGYDFKELDKNFPGIIEEKMPVLKMIESHLEFYLQPLEDIHLHSSIDGEISANGSIRYVYILSIVALLILLIASINYVNLSTARSARRAKEIGMRKVLGAERNRLIRQFLGESMFFSIIAFFAAILMVAFVSQNMSSIIGRDFFVGRSDYIRLLFSFVGLTLFVGFLAGIYPAFFLSSFKPVKVISSGIPREVSGSKFRSSLVTVQFVISITLIIGTMIMLKQMNYLKNMDAGFDKENIMVIQSSDNSIRQSYNTLKEKLREINGVLSVGAGSHLPGWGGHRNAFKPEGFDEKDSQMMASVAIDPDFIPTLGMEIIQGRNFSPNFPNDPQNSVLINETAARKFGWDEPVGKKIYSLDGRNSSWTVIGMVKDYHIMPLTNSMEPVLIGNTYDSRLEAYCLKISTDNITGTIENIRTKWNELAPGIPFDYSFFEESFNRQFRDNDRLSNIITYFTGFAILIACLGLFGIAVYTAEQRTKEIGIRKVLGSTVFGIISQLNKEIVRIICIAIFISCPAAFYFMDKWLEDFPYRIEITFDTFIIASILVFLIGILTVSFHSVKAALSNPVNSLRTE
ncbi:MAG: FtsX-like permease family protein [bacterium]|nr:FtsX-like permease family protein [bacterium]